jgi:hypothetical protein
MTPTPVFVCLNVAKATLDVALRPSGEQYIVPNDEAGAGALVEHLCPLHPTLARRLAQLRLRPLRAWMLSRIHEAA